MSGLGRILYASVYIQQYVQRYKHVQHLESSRKEKRTTFGSVVEQEQQENYSTAIPNVMGIQNKLSKQPARLWINELNCYLRLKKYKSRSQEVKKSHDQVYRKNINNYILKYIYYKTILHT